MSVIPLVINGLHRSGTTMTERLFDSQPDITCFTLFIQAIRAIAIARGFSDKGEIMTEDFEQGPNVIGDHNDYGVRMSLIMDHVQRVYGPFLESNSKVDMDDLTYGLDRATLLDFVEIIATHEDLSDFGSLLQKIGQRISVKVCATRWTGHHRFASVFLRNPNARWLELVRNPYARLASERTSHTGHLEVVLRQQQDHLNFVTSFRHERYKVVRYEDLCDDTDRILADISEWLGVEITNRELLSVNRSPFRPNTSDNLRQGKELFYQNDSVPARPGALKQDRWRQHLSGKMVVLLNHSLDFHGLYEKEPAPFVDHIWGGLAAMRLHAGARFKRAVKTAIGLTGYAICRRPRHSV